MHHLTRDNLKGARLQFNKAARRLAGYPPSHMGVELEVVKSFLDGVEDQIEAGREVKPPVL